MGNPHSKPSRLTMRILFCQAVQIAFRFLPQCDVARKVEVLGILFLKNYFYSIWAMWLQMHYF